MSYMRVHWPSADHVWSSGGVIPGNTLYHQGPLDLQILVWLLRVAFGMRDSSPIRVDNVVVEEVEDLD